MHAFAVCVYMCNIHNSKICKWSIIYTKHKFIAMEIQITVKMLKILRKLGVIVTTLQEKWETAKQVP